MLCVFPRPFYAKRDSHSLKLEIMKYNHYIMFNLVQVDDAVAIKVIVDKLQVLVTDIQSLDFYSWLEKRYTFPNDINGGDIIPDKFMIGVSRKIIILSVVFEHKTIDSDLFTRLVRYYREEKNFKDWDCDLIRFVRLFMTKDLISKLSVL